MGVQCSAVLCCAVLCCAELPFRHYGLTEASGSFNDKVKPVVLDFESKHLGVFIHRVGTNIGNGNVFRCDLGEYRIKGQSQHRIVHQLHFDHSPHRLQPGGNRWKENTTKHNKIQYNTIQYNKTQNRTAKREIEQSE